MQLLNRSFIQQQPATALSLSVREDAGPPYYSVQCMFTCWRGKLSMVIPYMVTVKKDGSDLWAEISKHRDYLISEHPNPFTFASFSHLMGV